MISARCVEIFGKLTQGERDALRAIAVGQIGPVTLTQLVTLKSRDLIHQDGLSITLTAKSREVADLC